MPNDIEIMRWNRADQLSDELDGLQGMAHLAAIIPIILELKGDKFTGVVLDTDL
jgi:hypothetical protein